MKKKLSYQILKQKKTKQQFQSRLVWCSYEEAEKWHGPDKPEADPRSSARLHDTACVPDSEMHCCL